MYPSATTKILVFFQEEAFDGPGETFVSVMRADRSIDRDSAHYKAFSVYACLMLFVWPVGGVSRGNLVNCEYL